MTSTFVALLAFVAVLMSQPVTAQQISRDSSELYKIRGLKHGTIQFDEHIGSPSQTMSGTAKHRIRTNRLIAGITVETNAQESISLGEIAIRLGNLNKNPSIEGHCLSATVRIVNGHYRANFIAPNVRLDVDDNTAPGEVNPLRLSKYKRVLNNVYRDEMFLVNSLLSPACDTRRGATYLPGMISTGPGDLEMVVTIEAARSTVVATLTPILKAGVMGETRVLDCRTTQKVENGFDCSLAYDAEDKFWDVDSLQLAVRIARRGEEKTGRYKVLSPLKRHGVFEKDLSE